MKPVFSICELSCWIGHMPDRPWRTGHEVEDCLQAHVDNGLREVVWKLGRSTIEYHSSLPDATLYTGEGDPRPHVREMGKMYRERCCLQAALEFARANDMVLYGRLAMNRHYSVKSHGGSHTSRFAASHPEFHEVSKEGHPDSSRLCYAFDEVRKERVAILLEAAEIGCHGLQLDFCRQPPMARYHPELVSGFAAVGGVDPRDIDPWDGSAFRDFISWRAEFVTAMMRDLHDGLTGLREKTGRAIPLQVRVPDNGLDIDLMAGLDIVKWCEEGLIQELSVSSLKWLAIYQEHDLRPYVDLGRRTGVKVYGGVNALAIQRVSGMLPGPEDLNPVVFAERAVRQYEAGAEGMSLYQSDFAVWPDELCPVLPILGDPDALADYVNDPAVRARYPVTYRNQLYGVDNHSNPLGTYYLDKREPGV